MKTHILDCTIRDGGYINNWNFSQLQVRELYKTLNESNVDFMEIGFRDNLKTYNNKIVSKWKKSTDNIIDSTIKDIYNENTKIAIMINYGTSELLDFKNSSESLVSMVRVAFHKKDFIDAIKYIKDIKNLGYIVCANAMGTCLYSDEELKELCTLISNNEIDYLYIADSYGSITTSELENITNVLRNNFKDLEFTPKLGFHAHNNTQRGLMNANKCIELEFDIIDSTMYGMGRGAGNLCTELLISDLSKRYDNWNDKYVENCVKYIYNYLLINDMNFKINWGYNLIYFITAHFNVHPNYGWKIKQYSINDINIIWKTIEEISKSEYSGIFNIEYLNSLIK